MLLNDRANKITIDILDEEACSNVVTIVRDMAVEVDSVFFNKRLSPEVLVASEDHVASYDILLETYHQKVNKFTVGSFILHFTFMTCIVLCNRIDKLEKKMSPQIMVG